jgi:hypothetical protein
MPTERTAGRSALFHWLRCGDALIHAEIFVKSSNSKLDRFCLTFHRRVQLELHCHSRRAVGGSFGSIERKR